MNRIFAIVMVSFFISCIGGEEENLDQRSDLEKLNDAILGSPNEVEPYLKRANYYFSVDKKLPEAERDIKRALAIDSSNAEVFLLEGKIFMQTGESARAKFSFLEAIEKDPNNIEARLELSQFYGGLTNYQKAIDLVNEALAVDERYAKSYFIKGLIYRKGGNDSLAISSLQTAVEMDNTLLNAYVFLGMIHGEKNDPLAVEYYNSALDLDPENEQVLYALAYFFQENGQFDQALKYYKILSSIGDGNAFASFNIGYIHLVHLEQADSSIIYFSDALKKDPSYFAAYYNRGFAYEQLQKFQEARYDYKAALTLEHNYPLAIEGMNRLDKLKK